MVVDLHSTNDVIDIQRFLAKFMSNITKNNILNETDVTSVNRINEKDECEICGWIAAVIAMIAFGSYGVPMKIKTAVSEENEIDPLVFQSYMSIVVFISSWIVLFYSDEKFVFTPWGVVSAIFWIPGGLAIIYAIKHAGLAIAIGIGNSLIVLVSFSWGIFIFHEKVKSTYQACASILFIMYGICGMSYFSSPSTEQENDIILEEEREKFSLDEIFNFDDSDDEEAPLRPRKIEMISHRIETTESDSTYDDDDGKYNNEEGKEENTSYGENGNEVKKTLILSQKKKEQIMAKFEIDTNDFDDGEEEDDSYTTSSSNENLLCNNKTLLCNNTALCAPSFSDKDKKGNWHLSSPRTLGILAAIFQGCWGGSITVPMQWASEEAHGIGFAPSFGIGSLLVTVTLWILRYCLSQCCARRGTTFTMPSFTNKIALPACLSGLLWNIGNIASMVSVKYLGEGVGYSVIQLGMMISGMWGICLFNEIQGYDTICRWFLSAFFAIVGILLLSYEHHTA